jgi:hypothetical protein
MSRNRKGPMSDPDEHRRTRRRQSLIVLYVMVGLLGFLLYYGVKVLKEMYFAGH